MGKHELEHLRKEAEQAIADADRWSGNAGWAAVAKTLMYVGELLADRLVEPRITGTPLDIEYKEVMGRCAWCEGTFPEPALNYSSGDPACKACQKTFNLQPL